MQPYVPSSRVRRRSKQLYRCSAPDSGRRDKSRKSFRKNCLPISDLDLIPLKLQRTGSPQIPSSPPGPKRQRAVPAHIQIQTGPSPPKTTDIHLPSRKPRSSIRVFPNMSTLPRCGKVKRKELKHADAHVTHQRK